MKSQILCWLICIGAYLDCGFFSLSGVFRQAHKDLHLSDMDDPQGEEDNVEASVFDDIIIPYFWNAGIGRYCLE